MIISPECQQCGRKNQDVPATVGGGLYSYGLVRTTWWTCQFCDCQHEIEEFVSPPTSAPSSLVTSFYHSTPTMHKRSNTIDAAAMSLGISPDLLESVLPTLREITEFARQSKAGYTNARIEFHAPTVVYDKKEEAQ